MPVAVDAKGRRFVPVNGEWVPEDQAPAQSQEQPSGSIVVGQPRPSPTPQPAPPELAAALRPGGPGILNPATGAFTAPAPQEEPNATYQERYDRLRADKDIARLERASEGAQMALAMEDTANQAQYWLDHGADTGFLGDARIAVGRALGGQSSALENFNRVASGMALDNVGKLKGPLSDKDIAFLRSTVVDVNASPQANRAAVEAQRWAARRGAAYEAALQEWSRVLGRPSALNAQGMSFDRWWGQYAAEKLPQPGGARPARNSSAPRVSPSRQPSAQERALAARFEADKQRIAELARRPAPPRAQATPARVRRYNPVTGKIE